jgi:hypothetical protein
VICFATNPGYEVSDVCAFIDLNAWLHLPGTEDACLLQKRRYPRLYRVDKTHVKGLILNNFFWG